MPATQRVQMKEQMNLRVGHRLGHPGRMSQFQLSSSFQYYLRGTSENGTICV